MKDNHKYRVNVYLGKEIYNKFKEEADFLGISLATFTKIVLETGYQLAQNLSVGGAKDGDK